MSMNIKFKDINPGMYPARISNIKEESGPYGSYLRFSFVIPTFNSKGIPHI